MEKQITTKLGLFFIISALALAGVGASYSTWFDTITIEGSVTTGSVSWEVQQISETHVWKIHGLPEPYNQEWGNEIYVDYLSLSQNEIQTLFQGYTIEEIASSTVSVSEDKHSVTVQYNNLFPCIRFKTDIIIEYTGTVPGKINDIFYEPTSGTEWITPLIASGDIYATAKDAQENVVEIGYQLHENDEIHIELWVHIPQQQNLMLEKGGFSASFEVIQWNEYVPPEPPCLQAYWSFNEGTGSTAHDIINDNHGTITGATWSTDEGINGCLYFDGNDFVQIPGDPSLDVTDEFSISVWIKADTMGWGRAILTRNFGGGSQYGFRLDGGNSITGGIANENSVFWLSMLGSFPNNEWTLISLVFDYTTNHYTVYKNTELVTTNSLTASSRTPITGDLFIGRDNRDTYYFDGGYIDEIKIHRCALTLTEIQEEYDAGVTALLD